VILPSLKLFLLLGVSTSIENVCNLALNERAEIGPRADCRVLNSGEARQTIRLKILKAAVVIYVDQLSSYFCIQAEPMFVIVQVPSHGAQNPYLRNEHL
jgi:hypothetical protein